MQVAQLGTETRKSLIFYTAPMAADELLLRQHGSRKMIVISPLKTFNYRRQGGIFAVKDEQSEERFKEVEKNSNYLAVIANQINFCIFRKKSRGI